MNNFALYKSLFIDSFMANLFFSLDNEYIIWVINLFGKMNHLSIILISSFGYMFAIICNYFFGVFFYRIFLKYAKNDNYLRYKNLKNFASNYWVVILFFSIFPGFGNFMFIFLGFLNIRFLSILAFGTFFKSIYYAYYLFY